MYIAEMGFQKPFFSISITIPKCGRRHTFGLAMKIIGVACDIQYCKMGSASAAKVPTLR